MLSSYMEIILAHMGFERTSFAFKFHRFLKSISREIKETTLHFLMKSIWMTLVSNSVFFLAAQKPFVTGLVEGSVR